VVDELTETADVLRAVLEPRGVRVEQASRPRPGIAAGERVPLSVVVVDEETAQVRGIDRREWPDVPRVLIGSVAVASAPAAACGEAACGDAPQRYLSKPFQYADLLRAIEALIAGSAE
jgi:DNA-binding response OmpR family regulator